MARVGLDRRIAIELGRAEKGGADYWNGFPVPVERAGDPTCTPGQVIGRGKRPLVDPCSSLSPLVKVPIHLPWKSI
jgi:hypothetical protein